jgi:hypothetical protein
MCHVSANDVGWPEFDGMYIKYPQLRRSGRHTGEYTMDWQGTLWLLRAQGQVHQHAGQTHDGNIEDLHKIWSTLDVCYERPEKYITVALLPILYFGDIMLLTAWP